ncbi:MAG TPA: NAD(P)/FAD-dependent oxidoreductase [Solirubrobacteraceae bacterium]|nr:NAD(P)/FAD-dependent oxidoreductase [Solirubrobacteraceae bacterium]
MPAANGRSRVVIVGGGFGGLKCARALARTDVEVTLVDRHNYHLFQPLSYQVATGSLSPGDIAVPLRRILRGQENARVVMGEVTGFDLAARTVLVEPTIVGTAPYALEYERLIVAGGSSYSYFGHEQWRRLALEVKSLDSALEVRGRILQAFEAAELTSDPEERADWLTFVVVGAGPTGVEIAGQIGELAADTMSEFRSSAADRARILLIETFDRVLSGFTPSMSRSALRALEKIGVTPMLGHTVSDVGARSIEISAPDGTRSRIPTRTVVWAAGVTASPLAAALAQATGAQVDRAGRLTVEADLTLPGHPEVIALGDMVAVRDPRSGEARPLPGLAPVAIQQGAYAARSVAAGLGGRDMPPFRYRDKGSLATIGRARAVAQIGPLRVSGAIAWVLWLVVHLYYLVGFENRTVVMLRWSYSFFSHGRGTRLITEAAGTPPWEHSPQDDA